MGVPLLGVAENSLYLIDLILHVVLSLLSLMCNGVCMIR